jgi:hypothetical protein
MMNKILLKRRFPTKLRILPLGILPLEMRKNDADLVKMVTYFKDTMQNSVGIPIRDADCPVSNSVGAIGLEHLKRLKRIDGWTATEIKMFQTAFGLRPTGNFDRDTKMMYRKVKEAHNIKDHREIMMLVKERLYVRKAPNVKQPNTIY